MIRIMKEYSVRFDTKVKGRCISHEWFVRAYDLKGARAEFEREYYEEDQRTAHPFHLKFRCLGIPTAEEYAR